MRKKEMILVAVVAVVAVGCIALTIGREKSSGRLQMGEEDYTKVVGTPETDETIFDEDGNPTAEAEEQYIEKSKQAKGKAVSKVDVAKLKEAKEMPKVSVSRADALQQKITRDSTRNFFEGILKKYGLKKPYTLLYQTGDSKSGDEMISKDKPYYYLVFDDCVLRDKQGKTTYTQIDLCKEFEDGQRLPAQDYSEEAATQEMRNIAQDYIDWLGEGYALADSKTWLMGETYVRLRDEQNKELMYSVKKQDTGKDMHCYSANIGLSAAGYPIIGMAGIPNEEDEARAWYDDEISIVYGECGLQALTATTRHAYQVTSQKDTGILSYKKAYQKMKQVYRENTGKIGCTFEVEQAFLGYVWVGDCYMEPVWVFRGAEDSNLGYIQILENARTGEVYLTPSIS